MTLESSTQTDVGYLPTVNNYLPGLQPLFSVNTCTDEDDISSFLGALFCSVKVGTNFLSSDTYSKST